MKKILLKIFITTILPLIVEQLIVLVAKYMKKEGAEGEGEKLMSDLKAKGAEWTTKFKSAWESASSEGSKEINDTLARLKRTAREFIANATGKSPAQVDAMFAEVYAEFEENVLGKFFKKKEESKKEDTKNDEKAA